MLVDSYVNNSARSYGFIKWTAVSLEAPAPSVGHRECINKDHIGFQVIKICWTPLKQNRGDLCLKYLGLR